jgi:hypothetical protein
MPLLDPWTYKTIELNNNFENEMLLSFDFNLIKFI